MALNSKTSICVCGCGYNGLNLVQNIHLIPLNADPWLLMCRLCVAIEISITSLDARDHLCHRTRITCMVLCLGVGKTPTCEMTGYEAHTGKKTGFRRRLSDLLRKGGLPLTATHAHARDVPHLRGLLANRSTSPMHQR